MQLSIRYAKSAHVHVAYQVFGDGSRVADRGSENDIVVTRTIKDLVAGSGISFDDFGIHRLKGVPDPWQLYRVAHSSPSSDGNTLPEIARESRSKLS
jgi:hypothetical protein